MQLIFNPRRSIWTTVAQATCCKAHGHTATAICALHLGFQSSKLMQSSVAAAAAAADSDADNCWRRRPSAL